MDCSPPGSSVHGIFQTRILEWVAMPSSRGSSRLRDQTQVSCIYCWATWEAPCDSKQEAIIEASADAPCSIIPPWNCAPTEDQVISVHVRVILLLREFRAKGLWYFYRPWGGVWERYMKTTEKKSTGISWYQWDHILRVSAFMTLNYISISSFPTFQNHILPKLIWII